MHAISWSTIVVVLIALVCVVRAGDMPGGPSSAPSNPSATAPPGASKAAATTAPTTTATDPEHSPATPIAPLDAGHHRKRLEEAMNAPPPQIVFLGDSITEWWHRNGGGPIWDERYAPLHALNLGNSGERTQQILWRIQNGEIDHLGQPKVLVLLAGTNNIEPGLDAPEQITAGIKALVDTVRVKLPQTQILLLAILPRGDKPQLHLRERIRQTNTLVSKLDDGKFVHFLDLGDQFITSGGEVSTALLTDGLHPGAHGYQVLADGMQPMLEKLLK